MDHGQLGALMEGLGKAATDAATVLANIGTAAKDAALAATAAAVGARRSEILAANERDMAAARAARTSGPRLGRLRVDGERLDAVAASGAGGLAPPHPL